MQKAGQGDVAVPADQRAAFEGAPATGSIPVLPLASCSDSKPEPEIGQIQHGRARQTAYQRWVIEEH